MLIEKSVNDVRGLLTQTAASAKLLAAAAEREIKADATVGIERPDLIRLHQRLSLFEPMLLLLYASLADATWEPDDEFRRLIREVRESSTSLLVLVAS